MELLLQAVKYHTKRIPVIYSVIELILDAGLLQINNELDLFKFGT